MDKMSGTALPVHILDVKCYLSKTSRLTVVEKRGQIPYFSTLEPCKIWGRGGRNVELISRAT